MNNKEKFNLYEDLLKSWSARMNLVAPSTLCDIKKRHFEDSAQLASILPHDVNIIDLGSGAGFPGVVLAVLGWNVTCTESVGKKARFLNAVKDALELHNLTIYNGRVEDFISALPLGLNDIVFTARAFAPLVKILDYVYKTKCRLFLLKGREINLEIETAKKKYDFDYKLFKSKTGDGFMIIVENVRQFHVK